MPKTEDDAYKLYDLALSASLRSAEGKAKVFSDNELLALDIVENKETLLGLCQQLLNVQLFRLLSLDNKINYALRSKDVAQKLLKLEEGEHMVYEHIESTGTNGIWTKTLKQRTNIAQNQITKTTGKLTKEGLIKQVRSIKNPSQKVLMLSHLSPSEGISGGPWHSDGELDMELIGVTADAVIQFIEQKSWVKGYIKRERSVSPFGAVDDGMDGGKKRKRTGADGDIEGVHTKAKRHTYKIETQLSYPPGYQDYPTVAAVLHFIKEAGFVKNSDGLTEPDIQSLLDVLVFDDRIEKIGGGYRTVRGISGATEAMKNMTAGRTAGELGEDGEGNGLTQAPCGRCPVFDLCEEGGPVNARNCVYFDVWLRA